MKSLHDYFTESAQWADCPRAGDELDIELAPDELVESQVIESDGSRIVLAVSEQAFAAMSNRGLLQERIARYGPVGNTRGTGFALGEGDIDPNLHPQTRDYGRGEDEDDLPFEPDQKVDHKDQFGNPIKHMARHLARKGMKQAMADKKEEPMAEDFMGRMLELAGCQRMEETAPEQPETNAAHTDPLAQKAADLAPVGTEQDPTTATTVDEGVMSEVDIDLHNIARTEDFDMLYDAFNGKMGQATQSYLENMFARVAQHNRLHPDDDQEDILEIMMDQIAADYGDGDIDPEEMSEAEYQGRKVPLGKPMRGDVKKFKVYVKDPKTGNVKKVNFGHGGTSAKRAGQKTMKIKKSNPARRKSFRARHNCDNPGPRTKARYWSCRAW